MKILVCAFSLLIMQCSFKENTDDQQKLECLNSYIRKTSRLPVYSEVRKGLMDTIENWKLRRLEFKHCNPDCGVLDSCVFFNRTYTRCLFLLIERSPVNKQWKWNFVKTIGGEKINGNWNYYHVSFPNLSYSLKSNEYKDFSVEFLSRDARLDIINRGFFRNGTCAIDSNFVDSDEWFADWVRRRHQQFLEGK